MKMDVETIHLISPVFPKSLVDGKLGGPSVEREVQEKGLHGDGLGGRVDLGGSVAVADVGEGAL
jgi:hypothetical protein